MRRAALIAGLGVLALAWFGPLLTVWRDSVLAHMTAHMAVVAIAAPLLAVRVGRTRFAPLSTSGPIPSSSGLSRGSTGQAGKASKTPHATQILGTSPRMTAGAASRSSSVPLSLPIIASLVELIIVWGWHAPAARTFAEASFAGTALEQASFLAAGLFLWTACFNNSEREGGDAAGAFGLLLTTVHMTLLGALLALSTRPLYGAGEVTCFGLTLDAAEDQQAGGVVMLLVGAAVYLAGGLVLLARVLQPSQSGAAR